MYTKKVFKGKLLEKLKIEFNNVEITDDEMLVVKNGNKEVSMKIEGLFTQYSQHNNLTEIANDYISLINNAMQEGRHDICLDNIYPFIRSKDCVADENVKFVRDEFMLDLDVLYVSDMEDSFRYIMEDDEIDRGILKERAFGNLNKITNALVKVDTTMDIYLFKFDSDYNASLLLLNENVKYQIKKKVGSNYLFAIPSATMVLIAKNRPDYIDIIHRIILKDPNPNKISTRVYRHKSDGTYEYADI